MKKKLSSVLIALAVVLTLLPTSAMGAQDADNLAAPGNFTESAGVRYKELFNMIYVEGGTFTLGWTGPEDQGPPDTLPVEDVTVSSFYISETEVTQGLYNAVMGSNAPSANSRNRPRTGSTWYDFNEFLGRLYVLTGRVYRMATEAEWEFAAKGGNPGHAAGHDQYLFSGSNIESEVAHVGFSSTNVKSKAPNILGIYDMSGNVEELVWNAWSSTHVGGVDPIGIDSPIQAQRTRRGGTYAISSYTRYATARQVRTIDGADGGLGLRIVLSEDQTSVPAGMTKPFDIRKPVNDDRLVPNSYRDPRWVTEEGTVWDGDFVGMGGATIKLWETGEVVMVPHSELDIFDEPNPIIAGQWYTVNNLALVIVPNDGGDRITVSYIFMEPDQVCLQNDRLRIFASPTGRYVRKDEASVIESAAAPLYTEPAARPVVPDLVATEDIAPGNLAAENHQLWDMDDIPLEARGQDPRLIDGPDKGWWMGFGAGGEHTYRKDFNAGGLFGFDVYQPTVDKDGNPISGGFTNTLVRGTWYTVNDLLLVVEIRNAQGQVTQTNHFTYFVVDVGDTDDPINNPEQVEQPGNYAFRHLTWQNYEKGDSRLFALRDNTVIRGHNQETTQATSQIAMGASTFRKPPETIKACPGIPDVGTCGHNIYECTCPVFQRIPIDTLKINSAALVTTRKNVPLKLDAVMTPVDATIAPNGDYLTALVWTSSNPAIATVDANGLVTPKTTGTVVITVKTPDGILSSMVTVRIIA